MADFLYSIDLSIFYFFNHNLSLPLLDKFFVFITEAKHWMITYFVLWGIVFFKGGKRGKIIAVVSLLVITVSDQLSSFVVKNLIGRIRPCNALPDVKILAGCTDSFSFPSSHTVNNFAIAVFIYKFYPNLKWILFIVATLVSISRIYVGRHYPSDVIGGMIIGSAIGYIFSYITEKIIVHFSLERK